MADWLSALISGIHLGKFTPVDTVGTVFDLSLSSLLIVFFGVVNELAKLANAELVIAVMFVVSSRRAFTGANLDPLTAKIRRFVKSNLVRNGDPLVQVLVVRVLGEVSLSILVAGIDLWELTPFLLAISTSIPLSYAAESLFTWYIAARPSQHDSW